MRKHWGPKDEHVLIPGPFEYVLFHGKGALADGIEVDHPEREKVVHTMITRVLIKGDRGVRRRKRRSGDGSRGQRAGRCHVTISLRMEGASSEGTRKPLEAGAFS